MTERRTKIVCTLGPATQSEERIEQLLRAGMNVARINFSHGTQAEHATTIARVRAVALRLDLPVAILQDLQGPKIRTSALAGGAPVLLRDGQRFTITTRPIVGTAEKVSTTYEPLPRDVKQGDRILLSDGEIELRVMEAHDTEVVCEVAHGGRLAEHQGINLPGVAVSAPALTEKDRADLAFGVAQRVDYIALSFVRHPDDLREAKRLIAGALASAPEPPEPRPEGLHPSAYAAENTIPVIAKLEKPEAIAHLEEILDIADGVMVARGDLGVEMPLEQVPLVQKRVIARANAHGLPVITATQMLESMISHPRPTRAEASDVANAILDGTDAVMLSGETAVGDYPVEAVKVMARIALETERECAPLHPAENQHYDSLSQAVSAAAATLADRAHARWITVFTRTGASARLISKERPRAPILAYTPFETVYRRLTLWWGVMPRRSALAGSTEELIAWVDGQLQRDGLARSGEHIVVMGGMPIAGQARTNYLKLHTIGEQ
ncbi:MAG: Pyruvate kinase [Ktedonobacterales bacterium]|jgi:pyruvate kinase|nr:MAG: Pyruvate kinase [Ktedonobacterales bacterium]